MTIINLVDEQTRQVVALEQLALVLGVGQSTIRPQFHNFKRNHLTPDVDYVIMTKSEVDALPEYVRSLLKKGSRGKPFTPYALTMEGVSKLIQEYYDECNRDVYDVMAECCEVKAVVAEEEPVVEQKAVQPLPSEITLQFLTLHDKLMTIATDLASAGISYDEMEAKAKYLETKCDALNRQVDHLVEQNMSLKAKLLEEENAKIRLEGELALARQDIASQPTGGPSILRFGTETYKKLYYRVSKTHPLTNEEYGLLPKKIAEIFKIDFLPDNKAVLAYYREKGIARRANGEPNGEHCVCDTYRRRDMFWEKWAPDMRNSDVEHRVIVAGWQGFMYLAANLVADGHMNEYDFLVKQGLV